MVTEAVDISKLLGGVTPQHRQFLARKFGILLADPSSLKDLELFVEVALFLITRWQIEEFEKKARKKRRGKKVAKGKKRK